MIDNNELKNKLIEEYNKMLLKIGVNKKDYLLAFKDNFNVKPYIEFDTDGILYYVVKERGDELERRKSNSLDDILFWIISDVIFKEANNFEIKNRIPNQDFRRLLFSEQIRLMNLISEIWVERIKLKQEQILKDNPFCDA